MSVYLHNRKADTICEGLNKVLNLYNNARFTITTICADPEFLKLVDDMHDMYDIDLEDSMAQAHVPQAERNNHTLKEHICALYHTIPFNCMPLQVLVPLVLEATSKLNYFPVKGGVSNYYSPRTILGFPVIDYDKHCQF